jgi:branched-chain amino acid transport system substrate-binding protein
VRRVTSGVADEEGEMTEEAFARDPADGDAPGRGLSRRKLLGAGVAGVAAGSLYGPGLAGARPYRRQKGGEYVIGCSFPLTGALASDGEQMKNGVTLAAGEINDAGGVAGKQIKLDIIDTDVANGAKIKASLTKHINNKVDALYEGYFLDWPSSMDIKANYGAPALNASTSIDQITQIQKNEKRYGNIIQVDPPEAWYGLGYPPFLNSVKRTGKWKPQNNHIFIVQGDSNYSQKISQTAQQAAPKNGWKVVGVQKVTTGAADWRPSAQAAAKSGAAAVMVTHFAPDDLAKFTKAWAANPGKALLYLQYGPSIPAYLQLAGTAANGIIWSTTTGVYNDSIGKAFQKAYQARFKQAAGFSNSGSGYDSVYMLAKAWGLVGDAKNYKAVLASLKSDIHRGVNGGYWLKKNTGLAYPDETRDASIGQAHLFFQIQNQKQIIIAPEPYTDAGYQKPPWL